MEWPSILNLVTDVSGLTWSMFYINYAHVFYCALFRYGYIMIYQWCYMIYQTIFFSVDSLSPWYGKIAVVSEKLPYRILVKLTGNKSKQNIIAKHIYMFHEYIYCEIYSTCDRQPIPNAWWCVVCRFKVILLLPIGIINNAHNLWWSNQEPSICSLDRVQN